MYLTPKPNNIPDSPIIFVSLLCAISRQLSSEMASGPPASAAESSKTTEQLPNVPQNTPAGNSNTSATTRIATSSSSQNPYASLATMMSQHPQNQQPSYQAYTQAHQNGWPVYPPSASGVPITSHYPQYTYVPYQGHYYPMPMQLVVAPPGTDNPPNVSASDSGTAGEKTGREHGLSRSPSPLPPQFDHWDEALREFLREARLIQALKGFECDMLVLNSEWERTKVPVALEKLIKSLSVRLCFTECIYCKNDHVSKVHARISIVKGKGKGTTHRCGRGACQRRERP